MNEGKINHVMSEYLKTTMKVSFLREVMEEEATETIHKQLKANLDRSYDLRIELGELCRKGR